MQQDHLSRQPFIDLLKNIIANQSATKKGYSIAIDGEWGSGKTWVLNELESQLDKTYLVFHYNAWQNDYYEEPLVAILSVMIEKLNSISKQKSFYESTVDELVKEAASDLGILVSGIVKTVVKIDIDKSIKSKKGLFKRIKQGTKINNEINDMVPLQKTLEKISKVITDLSENFEIIFIVDELDRCLPEYAIKVLGRLLQKAFKKDYKKVQKRHYELTMLDEVLTYLANDIPLPAQYKDHALEGNWANHRECHIQNYWLLIYQIQNDILVLELTRTGTHSDLFKR